MRAMAPAATRRRRTGIRNNEAGHETRGPQDPRDVVRREGARLHVAVERHVEEADGAVEHEVVARAGDLARDVRLGHVRPGDDQGQRVLVERGGEGAVGVDAVKRPGGGVDVARDLAGQDHAVGGDQGLAGDARIRIGLQEEIDDRVGDAVADLVGVTLGDGFTGRRNRISPSGAP